jgi:NADH:ubiquinone oxidoreductase subunit 2 (subunit N)
MTGIEPDAWNKSTGAPGSPEGFLGKFYIVAAGASAAAWALILILVITGIIGLFYYLRVVVVLT